MVSIKCSCKFCGKDFLSKLDLKKHNPICERRPKKEWRCKSCNEIFRTRRLLKQHRKDCHYIDNASQRQLNTKNIYCCRFCGKERVTTESGLTYHENYCKENPNRKILKGHSHTEETKKLLSNARKKFLQEHPDEHPWKKSSKFKSKPCEDLKQWLRENNIDFEEEVCVVPERNYSVDIAFPKAMLIVEVNGNQHYDLDKMELLPYYQKRHEEIEALGWTVLEVPYNQSYNEEFRIGLRQQLDTKQFIYNVASNISGHIPFLKTLAMLKKERQLKKQQLMFEKVERVRIEREKRKENTISAKDDMLNEFEYLFNEYGFKVDSLGRVLTFAPTKNDWIKRRELILNCGVDLNKFGWVRKVEIATGLTKRVIENTVKYFDLKVFKRKSCNVKKKSNIQSDVTE